MVSLSLTFPSYTGGEPKGPRKPDGAPDTR
jgi:hypothetical protein